MILIILVVLYLNTNIESKENIEVSNVSQESLDLGLGYGIALKSLAIDQDSQINGQIRMNTPQDKLEVQFDNRGNSGNYILKVLYDYKEANFKVDNNDYNTSYVFHLETGKSVKIPFTLDKNISNDDNSHKLVVAIYAAPEKHAKTIEAMTNSYGVTVDYEIYYNEGKSKRNFSLNKKYTTPEKKLNLQYQGLMINNNFKNFTEVLFPPHSIKVKKGEKIKLAYNAGKYSDADDYLIISMLDWKQIKMNDDPYLLIKNDPENIDYGSFYITAPNKEGLYEFSAMIIVNPTQSKNEYNFSLSETAYRFTIEVEK